QRRAYTARCGARQSLTRTALSIGFFTAYWPAVLGWTESLLEEVSRRGLHRFARSDCIVARACAQRPSGHGRRRATLSLEAGASDHPVSAGWLLRRRWTHCHRRCA